MPFQPSDEDCWGSLWNSRSVNVDSAATAVRMQHGISLACQQRHSTLHRCRRAFLKPSFV